MLPTNESVSLGRPTTSSRSHGTLTFELNTDSIGHPSGNASILDARGSQASLQAKDKIWPGRGPKPSTARVRGLLGAVMSMAECTLTSSSPWLPDDSIPTELRPRAAISTGTA